MKIVVGLGNPGPKYETTRHNAGFLAVDYLVDEWKAAEASPGGDGDFWQATVGGEKVLLVKPATFMNLSGRCVGPLFKFYKCAPGDLIVIYDDLDLKTHTLRLKTGGGSGGHNGIKSIDEHVGAGALNYHRVRLGIGRPAPGNPIQVVDYVLQSYSDEELAGLPDLFKKVRPAIERIIDGDMRGAMTEFNRADPPAK